MLVVLYRWRVDPAKEDLFLDNWRTITEHYIEACGGLGSRLHRGSDGIFYGYAQWPDSETKERAVLDVRMELARLHMRDAVTETFPQIHMSPVADHLMLASASASA